MRWNDCRRTEKGTANHCNTSIVAGDAEMTLCAGLKLFVDSESERVLPGHWLFHPQHVPVLAEFAADFRKRADLLESEALMKRVRRLVWLGDPGSRRGRSQSRSRCGP